MLHCTDEPPCTWQDSQWGSVANQHPLCQVVGRTTRFHAVVAVTSSPWGLFKLSFENNLQVTGQGGTGSLEVEIEALIQ